MGFFRLSPINPPGRIIIINETRENQWIRGDNILVTPHQSSVVSVGGVTILNNDQFNQTIRNKDIKYSMQDNEANTHTLTINGLDSDRKLFIENSQINYLPGDKTDEDLLIIQNTELTNSDIISYAERVQLSRGSESNWKDWSFKQDQIAKKLSVQGVKGAMVSLLSTSTLRKE